MKLLTLLCVLCACIMLSAREILVGGQSPSPYPDAEASTNASISVARNDVWSFEMRIDLECCESNCVQVAFGRDTDNDGDLVFG